MTTTPLATAFYYAGAFNSSGDRCTLRDLQREARDGWEVYGVDLNPQSYSNPYRVFVGTTGSGFHPRAEGEAIETLVEYATENPMSAISSHIFTREVTQAEIDEAEAEDNSFNYVKREGRLWREGEEWLSGIERIADPEAIATCPGGKYERRVKRAIGHRMPGLSRNDNGLLSVFAWQPGANDTATWFKAAETGYGYMAALDAWRNADAAIANERLAAV